MRFLDSASLPCRTLCRGNGTNSAGETTAGDHNRGGRRRDPRTASCSEGRIRRSNAAPGISRPRARAPVNNRSSRWQCQACTFCVALLLAFTPIGLYAEATQQSSQSAPQQPALEETVVVDIAAAAHPFPHYWEQMFGSGRGILSLRDSYRRDLREVKSATDFKYVRFHAIFHDEVGVYGEDSSGAPIYNFSYVDQIYDGLLESGVRPFVELSFMPSKLAARHTVHVFKYHPVVAPPRDYAKWDALISALASHLIERYGIDEVAQWYFEVWNEPNLDFWAGKPSQSTYWTLYDHTAKALKKVELRLR